MAIDLKLPQRDETVNRKFKIPSSLSKTYDLYVQAAQEMQPDVDEHLVMQAILQKILKKDRGFRTWLKHNGNGASRKAAV